MEMLRRFIKSSGVFFIGNTLSKIIVFFLLPIYTGYLSTEEYGYYDLSVTYITLITSLLYFDIASTIMRFMYDKKDKTERFGAVQSGGIIFFVSTLLYVIGAVFVSFFWTTPYLWLIVLYGMSQNLQNVYSCISRGFQDNVAFVLSGITNTIVNAFMNIFLLIFLDWDYSALYIASICGNIVQVLFLEKKEHILSNIRKNRINSALTREMFWYALPLGCNVVAGWILTSYNRTVITSEMSVASNGIFAIGNKFGTALALVTTCFSYAWQDISFSRNPSDPNNGQFFAKSCKYYYNALCFGVVWLLVGFKLMFPILVGKNFAEAYDIIPGFLFVAILSSVSIFMGNIFYSIKQTKMVFFSMIIAAVVNVALTTPLINVFKLNGANMAAGCAFLVNILLRYVILYKKIGYKSTYVSSIVMTFVTIVGYFLYTFAPMTVNVLWVLVLTGIVLLLNRKHISGFLKK